MLIVLGSAGLARYPQGGGHWSWFLQYPLGLKALGHDVRWLEVMRSSGDAGRDRAAVGGFFELAASFGLADETILIVPASANGRQAIESCEVYGSSRGALRVLARSADMLWNIACGIREPLLASFSHRVLIDVDPGHLQVAALATELDIGSHEAFLSVGARLAQPDCGVPRLDHEWRPFRPFVHLPMWQAAPDPGPAAPFSSITHWTWEELLLDGRLVSVSKRTAYLRYLELPLRMRRAFRLALFIGESDPMGDRALLERYGWACADPYQVAGSPAAFQRYIAASRAEFQCPKPIYRELRTGWFSDRSVAYLATGRPVLAEETGFSESIPAGRGLLAFRDLDEAAAGVAEIDANYAIHSRAAREIAEQFFDARRCLETMIAASARW